MNDAGFTRSMPTKGCSLDNSACEDFFGKLKNEISYGKDWKGISVEDFMDRVDVCIHWYNEKRIKMLLGDLSPLSSGQRTWKIKLSFKSNKSYASPTGEF